MKNNKQIIYVQGMHCSSCELLIEKQLQKTGLVSKCNASLKEGEVELTYKGPEKLSLKDLNKLFKSNGYTFFETKPKKIKRNSNLLTSLFIAAALLTGFYLLERTGIGNTINITSTTAVPTYFFFGLVAGISTCAALIGGLLLSLTQKWNEVYIGENTSSRAIPFTMFNIGRIVSFTVLGGVLGLIGSAFHISLSLTAAVTMAVALLMLVLGLQMIGISWASKFQVRLPKRFTTNITNEENFKGKYMPLTIGALTFFLPCGFTILAQTSALASGSFLTGSLIMLLFALGTLPTLALISFTSIKLTEKPAITAKFSYVAGILVVFFAVYNLNSQFNVLGWKSLSDLRITLGKQTSDNNISASNTDVQVIQMEANAYGYHPRNFTLRSGVPVRWEIADTGTNGCTNAIIARGLIDGSIRLRPGMNVYEFTPQRAGVYKATCWMGMAPPVTIEVI
jgi:uncharacterized protein